MLISKDYAAEKRDLIDPQQASPSYCPGVLEHGDMVYFCSADSNGMMVSHIQSNFIGESSGVFPSWDLDFRTGESHLTSNPVMQMNTPPVNDLSVRLFQHS